MKSTLFTKVLDETVLELNVPVRETIQRLCAQSDICSETDSMQHPVSFRCNKKGKLRISNLRYFAVRSSIASPDRAYYLKGQVVAEDGKTKIKIYSVYSRAVMAFRCIIPLLCLLAMAVYLLIGRWPLFSTPLDIKMFGFFLLLVLMFVATVAWCCWLTLTEKKNKDADFERMKDEVAKRVEAVRRWDE